MKRFSLLLLMAALLVSAAPALADDEGPTVGEVYPLEAYYDVPQTYYVSAEDPDGVESCILVVSTINETPMSYNDDLNLWEAEYTMSADRIANSIRAKCTDTEGNETVGDSNIATVAETPMETTDGEAGDTDDGTSDVDATTWTDAELIAVSPVLIKTVCPGGEDFTHTCRTVYFLDDEGYRHAFPNERAFFTWYDNYDDLHLITSEMMASFPLGANVTYHPGTKMVKFPTVPTVYTVGRYGELRAIASEEMAIELYGEDWNQQIDDISESLYSNYTIGDPLVDASDFHVENTRASVSSINDNLHD